MELEHERLVPHPPASLWARLASPAAWPDWATGVARVVLERGDGTGRGDLFRVEIQHKGVQAHLEGEVTASEPEALHTHRLWNEQIEVTTTTRLRPAEGGSHLHQSLSVTIHAFALQLLGKKIRTELEAKQAADLAALAQLP